MDLGIAGRTALVTASSRGLGKASALALAAEGADVVICGRDGESLRATAAELEATGAGVVAEACDVTEPDAPQALVDLALERFGRLDIVVGNAGGPPALPALELDDDQVRAAVEANLLTSVRLARAALPSMSAANWGRICCITSATVLKPSPRLALSNLARTGLWAWAQTAAADLAESSPGVTLNLVCPGSHATDRMLQLGGGGGARLGDPAQFGRVVAFLCSAPAEFVNGSTVMVDGGRLSPP